MAQLMQAARDALAGEHVVKTDSAGVEYRAYQTRLIKGERFVDAYVDAELVAVIPEADRERFVAAEFLAFWEALERLAA